MRRTLASCLLALLVFGFGVPFCQGGSSDVPVCCRRDGKHHCGKARGSEGFRSVNACPYRHLASVISHGAAVEGRLPSVSQDSPSYPLNSSYSAEFARFVFGNAQMRAPPARETSQKS